MKYAPLIQDLWGHITFGAHFGIVPQVQLSCDMRMGDGKSKIGYHAGPVRVDQYVL